jgi:hypothetical protein
MTQTACWLRYTKMTIPILKHYEPMGALCNVTQRFSLAAGWCTGTCHICAGDWAHPMPHLHRDWAHPCAHLRPGLGHCSIPSEPVLGAHTFRAARTQSRRR